MRRYLIIIPLVLPILLYIAYQPINSGWTVKKYGCGCYGGFNANHFNALLWFWVTAWCAWVFVRMTKTRATRRVPAITIGLMLLVLEHQVLTASRWL